MRVATTLASKVVAALVCAVVATSLQVVPASAAGATPQRAVRTDALRLRVTSEIDEWAAWLRTNKVKGYVGEVGWPSDDPRWNTLANSWFNRADAAGVAVTTWVAGEWAASHQMVGYVRSSEATLHLDSARANALVAEGHYAQGGQLRGVNVTGPEMGSAAVEPTSTFSNINFGALEQTYHYDSLDSYRYLASRGVRLVRVPFRWERVQRKPFGPLDSDEMGRLRDTVHAAHAAGLKVVIDLHNFAGYYLHDPATGRGVRRSIGSRELPVTAFTDVWTKLAGYFAGDASVYAFGLMNEPVGMAARGTTSAARVWEQASQQAVNVIRARGDKRTIMVPGYQWSNLHAWASNHPVSWIKDPAKNFRYEAHQYFDANRGGVYASYDQEVAAVVAAG